MAWTALPAMAQLTKDEYEVWKKKQQQGYAEYKQKSREDYKAFRQKANDDYAKWLAEQWTKVPGHGPMPKPVSPKPPRPKIVLDDKLQQAPLEIPFKEIVPPVLPAPPIPTVPLPVVEEEPEPMRVLFYGTTLMVHWSEEMRFGLRNVEGETLSKAWERLSDGSYEALLRDCLQWKDKLALSDWGYIMLVRWVTKACMGAESNEAKLLQQWLLCQSGFQVRLGVTERAVLYVLVPFDELVYNVSWLEMDGLRYFVIGCTEQATFSVMGRAFEGERMPSLGMPTLPKLDVSRSSSRSITSKRYPELRCSVTENKNLIDFLNDYPLLLGNWHLYSQASLSDAVKDQLYTTMKEKLQRKSEKEKVEMLLNWVQTGFEYEYDEKQFGGERSLFADETLYYPYCDCEDRSILFSILVRDLLGLDVVLLHFPGHLATAVNFTERVDGDYLLIDGKTFVVCDPTYIGASVGMSMPECQNAEIRIYPIGR